MSDFETLTLSKNNAIATLTLNRPDAANGLNMKMGEELMRASIEIDEDTDIRAVIINANGKMFCAGGDLKEFASFGEQTGRQLKALTTHLHAAISRFNRMPKPVIVSVNGMAAGAGFSLAVAGDIVIAADNAKFTMAYTAAGLSPDGSASYFLPRLIGLRKTQELMLSNRRLSAEEALQWGLITQMVSADDLEQTTLKLATEMAQGPTLAYSQVKQLLLNSFDNSLETQLELESRGITAMGNSLDGQEGIQAFTEKRAPVYQGK